jgi:hypothetical protein
MGFGWEGDNLSLSSLSVIRHFLITDKEMPLFNLRSAPLTSGTSSLEMLAVSGVGCRAAALLFSARLALRYWRCLRAVVSK